MGRKTYKDGQVVETSGRYAALHSTPHRLIERATDVEGDRFHRCPMCPLGVIYRLEQPAVPAESKFFRSDFAFWPGTVQFSAAFRSINRTICRCCS
jgi:hypothetical protein